MLTHIARDCQSNETIHLFTEDPKQELLEHFDRKTAEPMYVDSKTREHTYHTGWIIAGHWLEIYKVEAMRIKQ